MKAKSFTKKSAIVLAAVGIIGFSIFAVGAPAFAATQPAATAPVAAGTDTQANGCGVFATTTGNAASTSSNNNNTVADPAPSGSVGQLSINQGNATFCGVTGLIGQVSRSALAVALNRLGYFTTPQVTASHADKGNWFISSYRMMRVMGLYILMPMVLLAIIHSIMKASLKMLLKSVFVFLPLAIIGTVVAIDLVQLLLNITDDFSNVFVQSILNDANSFFQNLEDGLVNPEIPLILTLLMTLMLTLVSIFVFVILIIRESSIYIATAFLPIGFAMMVWPSTAQWFKRIVEFIVGLILSKIVMVATISLAIAALTSASGSAPSTAVGLAANGGSLTAVNAPGTWGSVFTEAGNVLSAIALLAIVCWAPSMTISLVAKLGVGEMSQHVAQSLERPNGFQQLIFYDRVINMSGNFKGFRKGTTSALSAARAQSNASPSYAEQALGAKGIWRTERTDDRDGSLISNDYSITEQELIDAGVDSKYHSTLMAMADPSSKYGNDPNHIMASHMAMALGSNFDGFVPSDNASPVNKGDRSRIDLPVGGLSTILATKNGESLMMMNITDRNGRMPNHVPRMMYKHVLRNEIRRQQDEYNGSARGIHIVENSRTQQSRTNNVAGRYGSVTGMSRAEDRRQRDLASATTTVRDEFTTRDRTTKKLVPPNIFVTYQTPAGVESRLNRPLENATADRTPLPPVTP